MATRKHQNAVEAAIAAGEDVLTEEDGPLLELARTLARQMDDAGAQGPGTRLAGTYLTTVRALSARLFSVTRPVESKLAQLRAQRGLPPTRRIGTGR